MTCHLLLEIPWGQSVVKTRALGSWTVTSLPITTILITINIFLLTEQGFFDRKCLTCALLEPGLWLIHEHENVYRIITLHLLNLHVIFGDFNLTVCMHPDFFITRDQTILCPQITFYALGYMACEFLKNHQEFDTKEMGCLKHTDQCSVGCPKTHIRMDDSNAVCRLLL